MNARLDPNPLEDDSRKGAKHAKIGEIRSCFSLRSWSSFGLTQDGLGAIKPFNVISLLLIRPQLGAN
jgi:hypothetical protein